MRMTVAMLAGALVTGLVCGTAFGGISPSVHFNGAVGSSSADHVEALAVGHHDPTREDGAVQALEAGASLRVNDVLQGFATYALHYGYEEEWEGEWEEAFLKLANLPGGFALRGGRMLARHGVLNPAHMHSWDFVDLPLVSGLLLGEDGLVLDGGDLTWVRRHRQLTLGVVGGYGSSVSHDHGDDHGDGHGDEAGDHGDEDHGEEGPDAHRHGWEDAVGYARVFGVHQPNDFNRWTVGLSGVFGDNEASRTRAVYGLDVSYQWRAHGLEPGGRALRWTTEVMLKDETLGDEDHHDDGHDAHAGDDHGDTPLDESVLGFYTQAVWTWHEKLDTGLRMGYVEDEGVREARVRVSPAVTYRPWGTPAVALRLQYNYDDLKSTEEHTLWASLGLSWGGAEVR